jgi:uncharacterized phage protein gp47/JayE
MLFPNGTYEIILGKMLNRIETWAQGRGIGIDTREGSLIRTALSPAAAELQQMYIELEEVMNESYADTASRDFLIRRCAERGITVELATAAIRRGEFNIPVPIGARFSLNKLNYVVIAPVDGELTTFQLQCETVGEAGNAESGALIPIDYIAGLEWARLAGVLIPGEDEEDTEHLRQRYFASLNAQAYGGNIQDYVEKTLALPGVGGVKVYPVWQGGGTAKLIIVDSQFNPPSGALIDAVQTAIDPVVNQGVGLGIAPIGHFVTVAGVAAETVDVAVRVTFAGGYDWGMLRPYFETAIDEYFAELSRGWDGVNWRLDPAATLIVRISQIETRLLAVTGVLDVADATINGVAANLTLDVGSIPRRGALTSV